jgi:deoxyribonuclease V
MGAAVNRILDIRARGTSAAEARGPHRTAAGENVRVVSWGIIVEHAIAFVDVHYHATDATAACVIAHRWTDAAPTEVAVVSVADIAPYAPGRFYERELPCLLAVLERLRTAVEVIVVDGYVILDEHGTAGLGGHLHARLGGEKAVVGVAKTAFRGSGFATAVLRGTSLRPLYVTAMGMEVEHAARLVASMHGDHRIPTLLGLVDRLARGTVPADP